MIVSKKKKLRKHFRACQFDLEFILKFVSHIYVLLPCSERAHV